MATVDFCVESKWGWLTVDDGASLFCDENIIPTLLPPPLLLRMHFFWRISLPNKQTTLNQGCLLQMRCFLLFSRRRDRCLHNICMYLPVAAVKRMTWRELLFSSIFTLSQRRRKSLRRRTEAFIRMGCCVKINCNNNRKIRLSATFSPRIWGSRSSRKEMQVFTKIPEKFDAVPDSQWELPLFGGF